MPVYGIFIKESTTNQAEMDIYTNLAGPSLAGHDFAVLAVYGPQEVMEGPPCEGVVIVQFPTMSAAKAWYESPAYQAAREHRFKGAVYRALFVEGVA